MYIIINALQNVKRNMSRNIFMLVILVLVIVGSVVSLTIKSATSAINQEYRNQIGSEVSIEVNFEKFQNINEQPTPITMDQYTKLSESDLVKSFNLTTSISVDGGNIKGKDADNEASSRFGEQPSIVLVGATGTKGEVFPDFKNGRRAIVDGRDVEKDNEALVSEEFAKLNNLSVGDVMKLTDTAKGSDAAVSVTIVGIYSDMTKEYYDESLQLAYMNRRNEVLTTFNTTIDFNKSGDSTITTSFTLRSPKDLEAFTQFAREIGITDDYNITTDEAAYEKAVGPLESLNEIMTYFIGMMLIVSSGILLLLSFLSIRERQYEIGVLRAMGMKKKAVALGFITESVTILLISLVIGVSIGGIISTPVANNLLDQQIQTLQAENEANQDNNMVSMNDKKEAEIDPIDSIEAKLNLIVILQITGIGILLVLMSNLVAISYVTRFQPIDIMRKRD